MPWNWIGLAAGIIRTNHDHLIDRYMMPNLYNAYLISRLSSHGPLPPLDVNLLNLLRLTTRFKTTHESDVVFALLGFLHRRGDGHPTPLSIPVDYRLSESERGISVAESHMAQGYRPLSFLSDAVGISEKPTWSPRWTGKTASMLNTWSINEADNTFSPAAGLSFKRFPSTDPHRLNVEGVPFSQVAWRTATFGTDKEVDTILANVIRLLRRCHGGWNIWNASALPPVARALCGERDEYGGLAKDLGYLDAQFCDFIGAWATYHPGDFPDLEREIQRECFYVQGPGMAWAAAAGTVCPGRCLFYTTSGHIGLGPGNIALGNVVYILGGTVIPTVVRPLGDDFGVVGDCYLDGVMDGEAVDSMAQGTTLRGPVPVGDAERQAQSRYEPPRLGPVSLC
jgi:hypothetical protein